MKNKILAGVVVVMLALNSCTSDSDFEKGKKQLEMQGYRDVKNTGYNAFCCSNDDSFSTGFKAIDKDGNEVKGCFCSAIGKGVTIRFE